MTEPAVAAPSPATARGVTAWFAATLFVSACLLFFVQPMFAKMALPLLGGTPAVWNTCVVFFQAALLAGYSYAHLLGARLPIRLQVMAQIGVLLLPLLVLPIRIPLGSSPPTTANPTLWLLTLLALSVGGPFFAVSTSAPLLQRWFVHTRHPGSRDPYFLYAASNLGSLLALLAYPTLVEPHARLAAQGRWWAWGYGALVLLTAGCGAMVWRASARAPDPAGAAPAGSAPVPSIDAPPTWRRRLRWIGLAFVPSSLLLGVTTYLTMDIAPIPLLWVVPLALYLLTFVCVFATRPPISHAVISRFFPILLLPMVVAMSVGAMGLSPILMIHHLILFFFAAMLCHGELAHDRPSPAHLTAFYLWMSVGGVLGGIFNGLVAPVVFRGLIEYPLALVAACALRPTPETEPARAGDRWWDIIWPVGLGAALLGLGACLPVTDLRSAIIRNGIMYLPGGLVCYAFRYRRLRFTLGVAALLSVGLVFSPRPEQTVHTARSFFGTYRVQRVQQEDVTYRQLVHGTTVHGAQRLEPAYRRQPLLYFHPDGPLGQVFESFDGRGTLKRVSAVGLGIGSVACYATPGQEWTFYEIDPLVQRLAITSGYFTLVRDCLEVPRVVLGDARLSLVHAPEASANLIILDAFGSDSIPIHLLTREALQLYLSKLAPGGVIAVHISNRYLDLEPVLGDLAAAEHLVCMVRRDMTVGPSESRRGQVPSIWVALARHREDLGRLATDPRWLPARTRPGAALWTDDFSNLVSIFRWHSVR